MYMGGLYDKSVQRHVITLYIIVHVLFVPVVMIQKLVLRFTDVTPIITGEKVSNAARDSKKCNNVNEKK